LFSSGKEDEVRGTIPPRAGFRPRQEAHRTGIYSASLVLADGEIYATSEDGITTVVGAGPTFEVLAENHLEGYTLSSPAISRARSSCGRSRRSTA
jgi:hypothetical protein